MKRKFLYLLLLLLPCCGWSQTFVNLTPKPKSMTVAEGKLVLPPDFSIRCSGLSQDMVAEVVRFVGCLNASTGLGARMGNEADALLTVSVDNTLPAEGYSLEVAAAGISLEASAAQGLYYGLQTIKKILPANVMAEMPGAPSAEYALPLVTINDAPRFAYRGFMLDVARHFFTVEEVKRMLDVMSYYKMNNFHWHLSDDQGWRVEIKKYPRLTTVGATASNCYVTDLNYGTYWTNAQYGPFFYTQDEIREVVEYAAERHITVTPEIDMPGHFVAAMAAYPEFSCNPSAPPTVWVNGGISSHVLNVANPAAVQFAKDVLAELIELFPGETIHIGGDECPTSQWESNALCQARYKELGLTSYRQLQSHFIKDIADFVAEKGRRIAVWDEAISAAGADVDLIQESGAKVYCWTQGTAAASAKKAARLGLDNVYTPWGPYYINRQQSNDPCEETLPGDGSDNVERTYNEVPMPASGLTAAEQACYTGVQGTFWTEHVADRSLMEYLALPRLMAIAETGWTPAAGKNFADFRKRITADTLLLDMRGYNYGRHYILDGTESLEPQRVMPQVSVGEKRYYYRFVTRADGERAGRAMQLLDAASPLIAQYSGKGAAEGVVWTAPQASEDDESYDWQWWYFEQDAAHPDRYALVCKARPDGSLHPQPTNTSTGGRWNYDNATKHYAFVLGEAAYGQYDGNYYYSIRSERTPGVYLNHSLGGQGYAVNCYGNVLDGNGGVWSFVPAPGSSEAADLGEQVVAARAWVTTVQTYADGAKHVQPGAFSATAVQHLREVVENVDPASMSEAELAAFTPRFDAAVAGFRASYKGVEEGGTYRLSNAVEKFEGIAVADHSGSSYLSATSDVWSATAWRAEAVTAADENFAQSFRLVNVATGRSVGSAASSAMGNVGRPVAVAATGATLTAVPDLAVPEYVVAAGGHHLFPVPETSSLLPGIVSAGSTTGTANAVRPMGAAWRVEAVKVLDMECVDTEGNVIGTYSRSVPLGDDTAVADLCPAIKNHLLQKAEMVDENRVKAVYERVAYAVTVTCRDTTGAVIFAAETACPVGESYAVNYPLPGYYTFRSSTRAPGTVFTPETDTAIEAVFATKAVNGVRRLLRPASEVEAGRSYVIYDDSPANNGGRRGYRTARPEGKTVNRVMDAAGASPYTVWSLEAATGGVKVRNHGMGLYVPRMSTVTTSPVLSPVAEVFEFTRNDDGSWKIRGRSNGVCWDGLQNGDLVGWNDPGHPYVVYEYFAEPYFSVTQECVSTTGASLVPASLQWVKAASPYTPTAPAIEGYTLQTVEGGTATDALTEHLTVRFVYVDNEVLGVGGVEGDRKMQGIFDLSGRRLQGITRPGLYIIDGRKVMVK